MRLPLRLGEGSEFRLDMSYIINAIEVFLLSIPPERLSRILVDINPGLCFAPHPSICALMHWKTLIPFGSQGI